MELVGLRRKLRCRSRASGVEPVPRAFALRLLPAESRNPGREAEPFTASSGLSLSASLLFSVSGLMFPAAARSLFLKNMLGGGTMPSRRQNGRFSPSFPGRADSDGEEQPASCAFRGRTLERGEIEQRMTASQPAIAEHAAEMLKPAGAIGIESVQISRGPLFTGTSPCFGGGVSPVRVAGAVFYRRIIAMPAGGPRRLRDGACRLAIPANSKGGIT